MDGLGSPHRIGLLLPLHWQSVALLLATVATGATAVLAAEAGDLAGCDAAFVLAEQAEAALDAGVDDLYALSGHPMGAPARDLPPLVLDYAGEVPGHGDHFGGARPSTAGIEIAGQPVLPAASFSADDRLLTALGFATTLGAVHLLGALRAGASVVLLPDDPAQAPAVAAAERVTHTAGILLPGLAHVGAEPSR